MRDWLVMALNVSAPTASEWVRVAQRLLEELPALRDLHACGELSWDQIRHAHAFADQKLSEHPPPDHAVVVHVDAEVVDGIEAGNGELPNGMQVSRASILRLLCDAEIEFHVDGPDGATIGIGRVSRQLPRWLARRIHHRDAWHVPLPRLRHVGSVTSTTSLTGATAARPTQGTSSGSAGPTTTSSTRAAGRSPATPTTTSCSPAPGAASSEVDQPPWRGALASSSSSGSASTLTRPRARGRTADAVSRRGPRRAASRRRRSRCPSPGRSR